jgi:hypothetical protein
MRFKKSVRGGFARCWSIPASAQLYQEAPEYRDADVGPVFEQVRARLERQGFVSLKAVLREVRKALTAAPHVVLTASSPFLRNSLNYRGVSPFSSNSIIRAERRALVQAS